MSDFQLVSEFEPKGDQPKAIDQIVEGLGRGGKEFTLLGITGSGKTFTMANIIERLQRPTLIITHNKTLAAQLYSEFKEFFPTNAVEYFVSYYDYYIPEAYLPTTDTYIDKEVSISEELTRLRLSTTASLLTRRDVIVSAATPTDMLAAPRIDPLRSSRLFIRSIFPTPHLVCSNRPKCLVISFLTRSRMPWLCSQPSALACPSPRIRR